VPSGSLDEALEEWERRMILDALQQTQGVQARAAKILGVSERSLWYRIKKLGIQVRTPDHAPRPDPVSFPIPLVYCQVR
jgi:transcriptional regulator with GAF, ATPase, and Fis domain